MTSTDNPSGLLPPGTAAPEFNLLATPDQRIRLSEIRSPVVLIFYPADWSPVCGDELSVFQTARSLFDEQGAQLLGISVDGPWSHVAFRADRKLDFPLLSDSHPQGAVARTYGVYNDEEGTADRALYVLDQRTRSRGATCPPTGISPGVDGALTAVEALS